MNESKVKAVPELTPPEIIGFNKTHSYYFKHVLVFISLFQQHKINESK